MKAFWLTLFFIFALQVGLTAQSLPNGVARIWADATDARDLGQYELALVLYGVILEMAQDNAELYNSRGKTYFDMAISGQYNAEMDSLLQLALTDYSAGLRCTSVHDTIKSEILVNRGAAYGTQGQMDAALEDLNDGLRFNKKNQNGYLNRSLVYQSQGNYKKAVEDLSHYLHLNPNNAEIYYERGMLRRVLNNPKKAIKDLNRAISLNPNLGIAYLERARAYAILGDKAAAQQDYERANQFGIKMEPRDVEAMGRQ